MTTDMTTDMTTKLSALASALLVNCMMIGGVAYLFTAKAHAANVYQASRTTPCMAFEGATGTRVRA